MAAQIDIAEERLGDGLPLAAAPIKGDNDTGRIRPGPGTRGAAAR